MLNAQTLFCTVAIVLVAGCGKPDKEPKPSKIVEDFTGMTTIKRMDKIKKKIKEAEKAQEERFREMEELGKE